MNVPVVLLVYNRPDCTAKVFSRIREARPKRLFAVADGPRRNVAGEEERCASVRKIIEDGIDWPCDVVRDYAKNNLGCALRVSSGITKVFSQVEEAIILEDDCLPDPTFFRFCEEMLSRYRGEPRIGHIGGDNFQVRPRPGTYYYSRYNHNWGWATWRRAWSIYDAAMCDWPEVRRTDWLVNFLQDSAAARYWAEHFDGAFTGRIQTWDYQWTYTLWRRDCLSILPGVNLVQNIGFGGGGTHLNKRDAWLSRPTGRMDLPAAGPTTIARDGIADAFSERTLYSGGAIRRFRRMIRGCLRPQVLHRMDAIVSGGGN